MILPLFLQVKFLFPLDFYRIMGYNNIKSRFTKSRLDKRGEIYVHRKRS